MSRVGERHKSLKYGDMLIKEKINKDYFVVEFINTGFTTKAQISKILNGKVKDHYAPSVFGVGITANLPTKSSDGKTLPEYQLWCGMLERCYSENYQNSKPTYKGCSVSDNFKYFPYFMEWCNQQGGFNIEGFELDKDIVVKGNKVYSEDTCCFVPQEINTLLITCKSKRGEYPIGVSYDRSKVLPFQPTVSIDGKNHRLSRCATAEEAFLVYKEAKEAYIKEVANKWKDQIDVRAYNALMNYQVEITD